MSTVSGKNVRKVDKFQRKFRAIHDLFRESNDGEYFWKILTNKGMFGTITLRSLSFDISGTKFNIFLC